MPPSIILNARSDSVVEGPLAREAGENDRFHGKAERRVCLVGSLIRLGLVAFVQIARGVANSSIFVASPLLRLLLGRTELLLARC